MKLNVFLDPPINFIQDRTQVVHYLEELTKLVLLPIKKTSSLRQRPLLDTVCPRPTMSNGTCFSTQREKKPWKLILQDIITYPLVLPELDNLPIINFPFKAVIEVITPVLQLPNLLQIFPPKGSIIDKHVLLQLSPASIFRL